MDVLNDRVFSSNYFPLVLFFLVQGNYLIIFHIVAIFLGLFLVPFTRMLRLTIVLLASRHVFRLISMLLVCSMIEGSLVSGSVSFTLSTIKKFFTGMPD